MPTTARLVAAICLAVLAWVVTGQVITEMTERTNFGNFRVITTGLGLLVGWFVIGSRVGTDYVTSISIGLTGMVALVFWGLFVQAGNEMLRLSLARRYDGAIEAIVAVFQIGIDYAGHLMYPNILLTLVVGGVLSGVISEYANRRWG